MSAPPQRRPNTARTAERDARIFAHRLAGMTERQIAEAVGLSQPRVHAVLQERMTELVTPAAEQLRSLESARLDEMRQRAASLAGDPDRAPDVRLKANAQLLRISESWRKLFGLDAPESIAVTHAANLELTAETLSSVLTAVLSKVVGAAGLPPAFASQLDQYAVAVAQHELIASAGDDPGPEPVPPRVEPDPVPDRATYRRPIAALAPGWSSGPVPPVLNGLSPEELAEVEDLLSYVPPVDDDEDDEGDIEDVEVIA